MQNDRYLNDIVIVRLALIVMLVAYHSLCPFTGRWQAISEEGSAWLELIAWIVCSPILPTFVFISGIIVGHQIIAKGKPASRFIVKKFKRLIIPTIFFGIIFYIFLTDLPLSDQGMSARDFALLILNGYAHLWFLPMLFWCFVILYLIIKWCDNDKYIKALIVGSLAMNILSCVTLPLPFQMYTSLFYFNFFYIGFLLGRKKLEILKAEKWWHMALGWVVVFAIYWLSREYIYELLIRYDGQIVYRTFILALVNALKLSYMWCGTLALYYVANYLIGKRYINVSNGMRVVGSYCFGVYIFQEPILKFFYYKTDYIYIFPTKLIPLIAFSISLMLSLALTHLALKTRVGRYLLG